MAEPSEPCPYGCPHPLSGHSDEPGGPVCWECDPAGADCVRRPRVDKNNSVEIEQLHFGRAIVRIFLDRTSGQFWENQHETQADTLALIRQRVQTEDATRNIE